MDLNYTRDTTSGREGLDLLTRIQALDATLPGDRDDGVGERRRRGGGDAPRRPRLHRRSRGTTRASSRSCAPRSSWRARSAAAQRLEEQNRLLAARRLPGADRRVAGDAAGAAADGAGRAVGRQRPHHRRARHRQGAGGAVAARRVGRARRASLGDGQRRRPLRGRVRVGAVRPREGRVHRRAQPTAPGASSWPTAARCSSTRSPTCRWPSRPSCCACCRRARSSGSAPRAPGAWTCA